MIEVRPFSHFVTPITAHTYTLQNAHSKLVLSDFGASIISLYVPDKNGLLKDVVLGFDFIDSYLDNPACFGNTIGPSANRTDKAELPIKNKIYHLQKNDGPELQNNLHTDLVGGIHKRIWNAEPNDEKNEVTFSLVLHDGEYGLPGNRTIKAAYKLVEDVQQTTLFLTYSCTTDMQTFTNFTNHTYFNLNGHSSGTVCNHKLLIHADSYLPLRSDCVSRGTIESVKDTPFDFTSLKQIGKDIQKENEQLALAHGYDHCFAIQNYKENSVRPALLASSESGRKLEISIDAPGAHLYTGNWLDEPHAKNDATYKAHSGFAFESEFYPDCAHHTEWPQPLCTPDHPYQSHIVYRFFL